MVSCGKATGTSAGTTLGVKDFNAGLALPTADSITGLRNWENKLYFNLSDQVNPKTLWQSDGTVGGTVQATTSLAEPQASILVLQPT